MYQEITENLPQAVEVWGMEIARTEIIIDEQTKEAQGKLLNVEHERRAAVAWAEGDKRSAELAADASLMNGRRRLTRSGLPRPLSTPKGLFDMP